MTMPATATTARTIEPDPRLIRNYADRWAAYMNGPWARLAIETIWADAKAEKAALEGKRFTDGVQVYVKPEPGSHAARRIAFLRELQRAAAAMIDHLDGHEGFEDAADELAEVLWP